MRQKPLWLEVRAISSAGEHGDALDGLDRGEREAILLAAALDADHVVIDQTFGRAAAKKLGLHVIGTLGVLREATLRNLIDLPATVKRLQATSFHVSKPILEDVLRTTPKT